MEELKIQVDEIFVSSTTIARDLKLNLKKLLFDSHLTPEESFSTLLGLSASTHNEKLQLLAKTGMKELGFNDEQITEAKESAGIMGMLNIYYRFRHLLEDSQGKDAVEDYGATNLRMTSLARPALGKNGFEMIAFAVSVLNGCGMCISSHEKTLRKHEISIDKIHDLARLAAVVKGISDLSY